jgi:hypothetical protein
LDIGLLKAAVAHAPEGNKKALILITRLCQMIYDEEGRMDTHKRGICKLLWKKKGERTVKNIRPITLLNAIEKTDE